jgi:hypothetical protein
MILLRKFCSSLFFSILLFFLLDFSGCFLVKKIAGADIDPARFEKDREAKALEIQAKSMINLKNRLAQSGSLEDADITFYLSESFLNKITHQYDSTSGWLDKSVSYKIKNVSLKLNDGSAIASLGMIAHHDPTGIDVDLMMDCLFIMELVNDDLICKLEPYNISPNVSGGGILASADEIVGNLVKINLAGLSKNFPPLKIPVNFQNQLDFPANKMEIKEKVNMIISNPQRMVNYRIKLKEILIFAGKAFVAMNIENVEVK